jgi:hypothetical protein
MKKLLLILTLLLLGGCSANESNKEQAQQPAEGTQTEEKNERTNESLEELLKEVDVDVQLAEACSNLKVELTTAYLEATNVRPSIIGFCHNDGDVSLEQETAYVAIANYNEENKLWNVDIREHEFMYHPYRFAGTLTLEDKSERVAIELYEDPAAFGGTSAIVVSSVDSKINIERVNSTVTQLGKFRTEGSELIIEDEHTIEKYTYNKNNITHSTEEKETNTSADIVITYDKVNDDPLFASLENGKLLDLEPGDTISFKPGKPLSLVDFQIRTNLKRVPDMPDTFIFSESDMGETIELGEYPYDDMIVYTIGDPKWYSSQDYFNELNNGIMPGSLVQLTTPNSEIKTILKDEIFINEYGYSGAKHLEYTQYIYAIPFLEEEGDIIYSIIRKLPFSANLTGDDFIASWGEPTDIMTDTDSLEEAMILHYELDNGHYVFVNLRSNSTNSQAVSISLY